MRPQGHKTWVEISSSSLLANLRKTRRFVDPVKVMCVIKSNAYGHGLLEVARVCEKDADWFGVDSVIEARALRQNRMILPILILGYTPPESVREIVENDISFVVYSLKMLQDAARSAKVVKRPAKIHLKLETGLTRQGVDGEEFERMCAFLQKHLSLFVIEGVSMHFANIEDSTNLSYTKKQLSCFQHLLRRLPAYGLKPELIHTAASAAAYLVPDTRYDLIRLGIMLYGIWPSNKTYESFKKTNNAHSLRPVLSWKTIVAQVKRVPAGTPISYGMTERVERDSTIAVLPVGYWDGYDRQAMSRTGEVLIRGKRCKVLGRVCMNMCMVDVTDLPVVKVGDEVVLLGSQKGERISVEELAQRGDTIGYEIVSRINPLIPRIVVK